MDKNEFYSRVDVNAPEECWEWLGGTNGGGYGVFREDGIASYAHRYSFFLHTGQTPEYVCHKCDNPSCVNPYHLFAGDPLSNNRDAMIKGHMAKKLSPEDVREIIHSDMTQKELAEKYGVTQATISHIYNGRTWAWLTGR